MRINPPIRLPQILNQFFTFQCVVNVFGHFFFALSRSSLSLYAMWRYCISNRAHLKWVETHGRQFSVRMLPDDDGEKEFHINKLNVFVSHSRKIFQNSFLFCVFGCFFLLCVAGVNIPFGIIPDDRSPRALVPYTVNSFPHLCVHIQCYSSMECFHVRDLNLKIFKYRFPVSHPCNHMSEQYTPTHIRHGKMWLSTVARNGDARENISGKIIN